MPEGFNREKIGAAAEIGKGKSSKFLGGLGIVIGGALDSEQVQVESMDVVKIFDVWSGTWNKKLPLNVHPVRDAFDATGHDFFHTLSHEGLPGLGGVLLIAAGVATFAKGAIQEHIAKGRYGNA